MPIANLSQMENHGPNRHNNLLHLTVAVDYSMCTDSEQCIPMTFAAKEAAVVYINIKLPLTVQSMDLE
jgi:hypothetical protein